MSNLDENKVKDLLRSIVRDIFDCLPDNAYTASEKASAMERIDSADLAGNGLKLPLTEPYGCATVKHQQGKTT